MVTVTRATSCHLVVDLFSYNSTPQQVLFLTGMTLINKHEHELLHILMLATGQHSLARGEYSENNNKSLLKVQENLFNASLRNKNDHDIKALLELNSFLTKGKSLWLYWCGCWNCFHSLNSESVFVIHLDYHSLWRSWTCYYMNRLILNFK